MPIDILFGILGGLDPVGRATRLLLVLQERIDIRGEQSSFFRLRIVLGGVLPVVYLVYFEDSDFEGPQLSKMIIPEKNPLISIILPIS